MRPTSATGRLLTLILLFLAHVALGQENFSDGQTTLIKGQVFDAESKESIIGAWVVLADTTIGTITNYEGGFELRTVRPLPVRLKISFIGYQPVNLTYHGGEVPINIYLAPEWGGSIQEIVISASRLEERILEAPVSIMKMGLLDIKQSPQADFFSHLATMKGVQINTSGITLNSVNTRGFADVQNFRFLQLIDNVDMTLPGLGYALGNLTGSSELDVRSIEIVPGTGSALYGPNAFNGLLSIHTKSPFDYEGVSFYAKSGANSQSSRGETPFMDVGFRVAKAFGEKFAFKLNASYFQGVDWEANDESFHITPDRMPFKNELLALSPDAPNFDAVNTYGDEVAVPVDLMGDGNLTNINRTGFKERDLIDYNTQLAKVNLALHYRPTNDLEVSYVGRITQGDALIRHTTIYPLVNVIAHSQKLEVKGEHFFVRTYYTQEDARDSYSLLVTGAFIQEGLKPSSLWSRDYGLAFQGRIPGVAGGSHPLARQFADRDIPGAESERFQTLRTLTLENPDVLSLGSKFIDKSSLLHAESHYDFSHMLTGAQLLVGGNVRRYMLDSDGQLFNDGPLGFNQAIPVWEGGGFAQVGSKVADEHIHLRGAVRYDKNQNFSGRLSPRASVVFSLGAQRNHNFRLSTQTGFRNPSAQESYIALEVPNAVLLGGVRDNIENFNYFGPDGTQYNGADIFANMVTLNSFFAFQASGGTDPSLLQAANLEYLKQEQIFSAEFGYKALLWDRVFLDLNGYRNVYANLVSRVIAFSPEIQQPVQVYSNIEDPIVSLGAGASMTVKTDFGLRISGNYQYTIYNADSAIANNPGFLPGFNMPTQKVSAQLQHRDIYKGIGFSASYRWSEAYTWESPFGVGDIPSYQVVDAALTYDIPETDFNIKLGASNLLGDEYQVLYGGPLLGRQYFLSLTFDQSGK